MARPITGPARQGPAQLPGPLAPQGIFAALAAAAFLGLCAARPEREAPGEGQQADD